MTVFASIIMLMGAGVALIAGVGVLRFETSYARFHAAGKASPVAFLVTAVGAGIELGFPDSAYLLIAGFAMILTMPIGVHLLFRAVHRKSSNDHLIIDELSASGR